MSTTLPAEALILIAGPSGSGKSTVSRALRELDPTDIAVVHFDDFQYDAEVLEVDNEGYRNWDSPDFTDFDKAFVGLRSLKGGSNLQLMAKNEYDNPEYIKGDYRRKPIEVQPKRIIIAEGHYALLDERVRSLADVSIFLSVESAVGASRRTKLSDEKYDRKYLLPMHEKYVLPTAAYATEVVQIDGLGVDSVVHLLVNYLSSMGVRI